VDKTHSAKDIYKNVLHFYGENCLSGQAVYNWIEEFTEGRSKLEGNDKQVAQ
jgi:hypothetical protein